MLYAGAFGEITTPPLNTLVVRCMDNFANMTCNSTTDDQIAWTYDGNTVVASECTPNTNVFLGHRESDYMCNIAASLSEARMDPRILSISGPYTCTDPESLGVSSTCMVIVMGTLIHHFCETMRSTYLHNNFYM